MTTQNSKFIKRNFIVLIVGIFFWTAVVLAKTPTPSAPVSFFYLTWETDGLAPSNYSGKVLGAVDSVIKVSAQPLIYSAGKYLDSSKWEYRWLLNGELKNKGIGLKDFRFRAKGYETSSYQVRVKVVFSDQSSREKEIVIPVVAPRVLIKPVNEKIIVRNGALESNEPEIKLAAVPYFFGGATSGLKTSWYLNGQAAKKEAVENGFLTVRRENQQNEIAVQALVKQLGDSLIRSIGELKIKFVGL